MSLKKKLLSAIGGAVLIYGAVVAYMTAFQRDFIYFPDATPVHAEGAYQTVTTLTADGLSLTGLYAPPARADAPVLAFFHGNAGQANRRVGKTADLLMAGYGVLLAEYRGYGGNPGAPTEAGLYSDARAWLSWLSSQGVPAERTVIYGESLGTGVAMQMATETPHAAMVLEVPFDSLLAKAKEQYWFILGIDHLLEDTFRSDLKADQVTSPVLVIAAGRDRVIPPHQANTLFSRLPVRKKLVLIGEAEHGTVYDFGAAKAVTEFLDPLMVTLR